MDDVLEGEAGALVRVAEHVAAAGALALALQCLQVIPEEVEDLLDRVDVP